MNPVSPRLTWIIRKVLGTVGGRTLAVLVALVVTYHAWIGVTAAGKVADGVGSAPDPRGRFAVEVVLDFPPERFHMLQLQEHGRVRATDGHVIHLRSVSPDSVDAMARKYWISEILPGQE
jgi:hypothetical protein